jgi:hypothetical protein
MTTPATLEVSLAREPISSAVILSAESLLQPAEWGDPQRFCADRSEMACSLGMALTPREGPSWS